MIYFVPDKTPSPPDRPLGSDSSSSMNRELIQFLSSNKWVLLICFLRGCGSLLWGAADLLSVNFSNLKSFQRYGDKEFTLGLIYATTGIGCQIGPILWNAITLQSEYYLFRVIVFSFGQIGISYLIMMYATDIHHLLLATLIRTISSGIIWIYGSLLLQILVPSSLQGRVFTFERAIYVISKLLSTVMSGVGFGYIHWNDFQMSSLMTISSGVIVLIWSAIFVYHYHWSCGDKEIVEKYLQVPKDETMGEQEVDCETTVIELT